MSSFAPGSWLHWTMLAGIGIALALAIRLRRNADPVFARRIERNIGTFYLCLWAGTFVWLQAQPDYEPIYDLPLHLCHLAAACAALGLVTDRRLWRTLAYFWGLALCTQALVTPTLTEGPATWPFWFFWTTHAMTVAVPLYDAFARGYRPAWRDYALACAAAAGYVAIVLPIDLATGWNYGFVGPSRPDIATIVDFLGPWPLRLVFIGAAAAAAMAIVLLPWVLRRNSVPVTRIQAP